MLAFFSGKTEISRSNLMAGICSAVILAAVGYTLLTKPHLMKLGEFLAQRSYDLPLIIRPSIPIDSVVILYMNEESHDVLQQPYNRAWDREKTHARLLQRLKLDQPKAVVFDVVFSDEGDDPAANEALAKAMSNLGTVVLAADYSPFTGTGKGRQVQLPYELFVEAAMRTNLYSQEFNPDKLRQHLGYAELVPDSDLAVRRHTPFDPTYLIFPLSWAAAKLVNAPVSEAEVEKNERWINYYGPSEHLPSISYWKALDTNEIAPGFFKDRIIFVGSSTLTKFSGERKDSYKSIYPGRRDHSHLVSGVEIQATKFLNLSRGDWLIRFSSKTELLLVFCSAFVFGLGQMLFRPLRSSVIALVLLALIAGTAYFLLVSSQLWFAWLIIVVQLVLATFGSVLFNSYRLHIQRKLLQHSVAMYVSPAVATQVLRQPDMMKPGARKELLSIMFSDIANFTNMSEGMDSDQLAQLMNRYFETAVNLCIHPTQGTVVKYIGDAIFAIWNAPILQENHRELACRAALLMRDQVTDFQFSKPGLEIRTRIGLHTGMASVGNFGSSNRVDYTALGENINLTSRMEGLNKYLGTSILATGDMIEPVEHKFVTRYLGRFQLKGFAKAVDVYELLGLPQDEAPTQALRETFAAGLKAYRERDFETAELRFKHALQIQPKDGPSRFYLAQIEEFRDAPSSEEWDGAVELKEK